MTSGLSETVKTALLILATLFPIVNPLGNAPIFLTMTRGFTSGTRALLASRIAFNGFVLLMFSLLIGTHILAFFGISLPVVQVGGGMVVMATGWTLLQQKTDGFGDTSKSTPTCTDIASEAFYPLTLPLTVGPGSISVAITLGANRPERAHVQQWPLLAGALIGSVLIAASIYLSYRFAEGIARALGETAMNVILRLTSFILLCIGVQILWNGVSGLYHSL